MSQLAASAVPAHADVDSGHPQHQLLRGLFFQRFSFGLSKQLTALGELSGSVAIGKQPVMAQAGEASSRATARIVRISSRTSRRGCRCFRLGVPLQESRQWRERAVTFEQVYQASGWTHVGTTKGRGRYDRQKKYDKPKKAIWLRPLRKDWKRSLNR